MSSRLEQYRSVQYRSNNPNDSISSTMSAFSSSSIEDHRWSAFGHTRLTKYFSGATYGEFQMESAGGSKNLGIASAAPATGDVAEERIVFIYDASYSSGTTETRHYKNEASQSTLIHWVGASPAYIEVRHIDGSFARFSETSSNSNTWRMESFIDAHDVMTSFFFIGDQLDRIVYPNGMVEHWNWAPTNANIAADQSAIEVTYTGGIVDEGQTNQTTGVHEALTWGMLFEVPALPGVTTSPFAGDRLLRIYYPKSEFLIDEPTNGTLHALPGSPTARHRVLEFVYGGIYAASNELSASRSSYATSLFGSIGGSTDLEEIRYATGGGKTLVTEIIERLHGGTAGRTSRVVWSTTPSGGTNYKTVETTDPRGTKTRYLLDTQDRPLQIRVTPDAAGMPRNLEVAANAGLGLDPVTITEPSAVTWTIGYDPNCGCQKPTTITSPSGRVTTNTWDWDTGKILKRNVQNPATGTGEPQTFDYTWTWETVAPGSLWIPPQLKSLAGPYGTWSTVYQYGGRSDTSHGAMVTKATLTSPPISLQGPVSSEILVSIVDYDSLGRVLKTTDEDQITRNFTYYGGAVQGAFRLKEVVTGSGGASLSTGLAWDDWGKLLSHTSNKGAGTPNEHTISFKRDAYRQVMRAYGDVSKSTTGKQTIETLYDFDRWGNVAVERSTNKDSAGAAVAAGARAYIHNEYHFRGTRLLEAFMGRRPLDEGDAPARGGSYHSATGAPLLYYSYDYEIDGTPKTVDLPSGSQRRYSYDAYGTLYKSEIVNGQGQNAVLDSKNFINSELEVVEVFRGDASLKLLTKIGRDAGTGVITSVQLPGVPETVQGYAGQTAGAIHTIGRDRLGRAISYTTSDGTATVAHVDHTIDEIGRISKTSNTVYGAPAGASTAMETVYQFSGNRLDKVTHPGGRIVEFDYDSLGRLQKRFDNQSPSGNQTIYSYFANTSRVQQIQRKIYEETLSATTQRTFSTQYEYDELGRTRKVTELGAAGATDDITHSFTFFTSGDSQSYIDPIQKVETYIPDALGRLHQRTKVSASSSDIVNTTMHFDYLAGVGNTLVAREDGKGNTTQTYFDPAGRPVVQQNPGASTVPTAASPHQAFSTFISYDAASRIKDVHDAVGLRIENFFDGSDRLIMRQVHDLSTSPQVAQLFSATREIYHRNGLGQVEVADTLGGAIGASMTPYNSVGFDRDSVGRLHQEAFLYPGFGAATPNVINSDYSGSPDFRKKLGYSSGLEVAFGDDVLGRISTIHMDRSSMVYGTNPGNRLLAEYGHMGSRVSHRKTHWASGGSSYAQTVRTFDVHSRLSGIEDTLVAKVIQKFEYGYDKASNLVKEKYLKADATQLDGVGHVAVGDRFAYDDFNRLQEAWLGVDSTLMGTVTDPSQPALSGSNVIKKLTYSLDEAGNRTSVSTTEAGSTTADSYSVQDGTEPQGPSNRYDQVGGNTDLVYDDRGNLVYDGTYRYFYDFKNRLTEVYSIASDGEAMQASLGTSPAGLSSRSSMPVYAVSSARGLKVFDAAAAKIRKQIGKDFGRLRDEHRLWMRQGKLSTDIMSGGKQLRSTGTKILSGGTMQMSSTQSLDDLQLVLVALYGYDAGDRRLIRFVAGEATYLSVYDGWQEIEELVPLDNGGVVENRPYRQFVWGERLNELVSFLQFDGVGWHEYFVSSGGQDSVFRLHDSQGVVVEATDYDDYGRAKVYTNVTYDQNGNWMGGAYHGQHSSVGNPYQWKGHRTDTETGLIQMRFRYYCTSTGRFVTLDPPGVWSDLINLGNAYTYGGNSPQVNEDIFGLQGQSGHGKPMTGKEAGLAAAQALGKAWWDKVGKDVAKSYGKWALDKVNTLFGGEDPGPLPKLPISFPFVHPDDIPPSRPVDPYRPWGNRRPAPVPESRFPKGFKLRLMKSYGLDECGAVTWRHQFIIVIGVGQNPFPHIPGLRGQGINEVFGGGLFDF